MKIDKTLELSDLLIKGVSETIKNEANGQEGEFLQSLLGTLACSLCGSALKVLIIVIIIIIIIIIIILPLFSYDL